MYFITRRWKAMVKDRRGFMEPVTSLVWAIAGIVYGTVAFWLIVSKMAQDAGGTVEKWF